MKKFRAWDTVNEEWIDGGRIMIFLDGSVQVDTGKEWVEPADDEMIILVQSTGIRDENGVEAFEGDIIHFVYGGLPVEAGGKGKHRDQFTVPVDFVNGCFNPFQIVQDGEFKIIGNEFENPELLEG